MIQTRGKVMLPNCFKVIPLILLLDHGKVMLQTRGKVMVPKCC
jgi:hypothetical protein